MANQTKYKDVVFSLLESRLCDIQLKTTRSDVFNYCEEIRELLVSFVDENNNSDDINCKKCGCTEFLCGHNKRN